jgi:hypothetical protein
MTTEILAAPETATAIGNGSGNLESSEYAPVRAGARASIDGKTVGAWLRREFVLPEFTSRARPVWMWARYGLQCPPAGFARGLSRMYAALVALPVTVLLVWGEWVVARPTRLAVIVGLYVLLSFVSPAVPTPWRS